VGPDEHVLVVAAHHVTLDGWSFGVVMEDLGAFYAAARDGRPAGLPPRPDYAALLSAESAGTREDPATTAFWDAQFADGVPVLDLPGDRPRPAARAFAGERIRRQMDLDLLRRLSAAGRQHGLSMYNTLLSAYFAWLSRISGEHDVVVGTPSAAQAGRSDVSELVGYGIHVLPVRARMRPDMPFLELARQVRRTVLRALDHQGYSFPRLVERVLRNRDTSRPPVFSVMMNLDRAAEAGSLGGLRAQFDHVFGGGSKVDLNFSLLESPEGLQTTARPSLTAPRWSAGWPASRPCCARSPTTRRAPCTGWSCWTATSAPGC
jgi:hypothetical protein